MQQFFIHAHSGLRWLILVLLLWAIVDSLLKWQGSGKPSTKERIWYFGSVYLVELQVVIGFVLYFWNKRYLGFEHMDESILRFYALEHPVAMIIATGLLSVGKAKFKKFEGAKLYKSVFIFYTIALIVMLLSIPWSFRF